MNLNASNIAAFEALSLKGREFFNFFVRKMETVNGRGHIFVTFKDGCNGNYARDDGEYRQDLGLGDVSDSHANVAAALVFMDRIAAKTPEMAGRLEIVKAPCAFARRDSWVKLELA